MAIPIPLGVSIREAQWAHDSFWIVLDDQGAPFDPDALVDAVDVSEDTPNVGPQAPSRVLRHHDLLFDLDRVLVRRGEQRVRLSPTELALLEIARRDHGFIVTAESFNQWRVDSGEDVAEDAMTERQPLEQVRTRLHRKLYAAFGVKYEVLAHVPDYRLQDGARSVYAIRLDAEPVSDGAPNER